MTSTVSRHLRQAAVFAVAALALQFAAGARGAGLHVWRRPMAPAPTAAPICRTSTSRSPAPPAAMAASTYRSSGGVSLQFGARNPQSSFEAEYNSGVERLFNPVGRPGGPDGR